MSDEVRVKTNLPDFSRQMDALGPRFRAVVVTATKAGARVFQRAAKANARRRTGALRRAITVKRLRSPSGVVKYAVGVRLAQTTGRGRKSPRLGRNAKGDVFYWRFLEQGWIPRGRGVSRTQALQGGTRRKKEQREKLKKSGRQELRFPYLEPAFRSQQGTALSTFYSEMDRGVTKELTK